MLHRNRYLVLDSTTILSCLLLAILAYTHIPVDIIAACILCIRIYMEWEIMTHMVMALIACIHTDLAIGAHIIMAAMVSIHLTVSSRDTATAEDSSPVTVARFAEALINW